ncbi:hypothetical protein BN381_80344 [Candidatus Microthrix parvicella RN1]|uniref:Uncharacterized protein n=1 Tax=Candidatus Neomicrothrix parvicella RN1 TaxID=1229780 RepID=R4Z4K3_9ACTN|nr:hypothetical protein BN381_80344 [Candidatus Microthrix parvicella RN1]
MNSALPTSGTSDPMLWDVAAEDDTDADEKPCSEMVKS